MSTFDDRAKGFENQFARGEELEFKATARRNRMIGIWAGEKMGLEGARLEEYAKAVVRSDFEQPGDDDVVRKVLGDLVASNLPVRESELRTKMAEYLAQAREAIKAEG